MWVSTVAGTVTDAGNPWPLPFLPFLNPLDGVTLLVLITLAAWHLKVKSVHDSSDLHDPIADLVAGPVQRKADDNGCNRKSNQVPRALKEPSPGDSRLQQYRVEIHAIRRTKMEYSPDDIADGSDLVHG